jgi:hypothetical protein
LFSIHPTSYYESILSDSQSSFFHLVDPHDPATRYRTLERTNTTKAGPIPGGFGLKLLREFITMNKERIPSYPTKVIASFPAAGD